jgi:hypothetical protein
LLGPTSLRCRGKAVRLDVCWRCRGRGCLLGSRHDDMQRPSRYTGRGLFPIVAELPLGETCIDLLHRVKNNIGVSVSIKEQNNCQIVTQDRKADRVVLKREA